MIKERKKFQPLESQSVCLVYELLYNKGLISFPITDNCRDKIDALVVNINSVYFGNEMYKTAEEKTVAYLYFIIKDHAFIDGNKRTACTVFEILCDLNNLEPKFNGFSLDELAIFIERTKNDHKLVISVISKEIFVFRK